MTDISHIIGSDLSLSPTGDLAQATVPDVTTQRVLRRLLTNPGDYVWQLGYGGGLPRMVGQPANTAIEPPCSSGGNNALAEAVAEAKQEAHATRLTDEAIDAELDEWRSERRAT